MGNFKVFWTISIVKFVNFSQCRDQDQNSLSLNVESKTETRKSLDVETETVATIVKLLSACPWSRTLILSVHVMNDLTFYLVCPLASDSHEYNFCWGSSCAMNIR